MEVSDPRTLITPLLIVMVLAPLPAHVAPAEAAQTFEIRGTVNSADLSPDDELVVTEESLAIGQAPDQRWREVVRIRNSRSGEVTAESPLGAPSAQPFWRAYRFARFSPNGRLVVAYADGWLHIFHAEDLTEVKRIQLLPTNLAEASAAGHPPSKPPMVQAVEISPKHVIAVLSVDDMLHGTIQLYDLFTGLMLREWRLPQGWVEFDRDRGIAWNGDGALLAVAVPNETPCNGPTNEPDVFIYEAASGYLIQRIHTGLLVGGIAIADGHLLAVDENCFGVFKNHHPKLRMFDLKTGRHVKDITNGESGVRYVVAVSRDGTRFLAYTGKIDQRFDWGDGVPVQYTVYDAFTVWSAISYSELVSVQKIPDPVFPNSIDLRIGPSGRSAVSLAPGGASIFFFPNN